MNPSILPVSRLVRSDYNCSINDEIKGILKTIEIEIQAALNNRKTSIKFTLPIHFDIPPFDISRAQLHIYSGVLRALDAAGYVSEIEFLGGSRVENQKNFLYISWLTDDVKVKETELDLYIKKKRKRNG
jgi:hypothetical protein